MFVVFRNVWDSCEMMERRRRSEDDDQSDDQDVRRNRVFLARGQSYGESSSMTPLSEKQLSAIVRKILRSIIVNDAGGSLRKFMPGRNFCFVWHREEPSTEEHVQQQQQHSSAPRDPLSVWNQNVISFSGDAPLNTGDQHTHIQNATIASTSSTVDCLTASSLESFHMKPQMKFKLRNAQRQKFVVLEVGQKKHLDEDRTRQMMNEWIECKIKAARPKMDPHQEEYMLDEDDDDDLIGKFSNRSTLGSDTQDDSALHRVWIQHRQSLNGFKA